MIQKFNQFKTQEDKQMEYLNNWWNNLSLEEKEDIFDDFHDKHKNDDYEE